MRPNSPEMCRKGIADELQAICGVFSPLRVIFAEFLEKGVIS